LTYHKFIFKYLSIYSAVRRNNKQHIIPEKKQRRNITGVPRKKKPVIKRIIAIIPVVIENVFMILVLKLTNQL
jgi:hypothetical protein